jgi:hypothetical protein
MQYHKIQINRQIFLKRAETAVILIVFKCVLYHVHAFSVTVSHHSLFFNQVPEKLYYLSP